MRIEALALASHVMNADDTGIKVLDCDAPGGAKRGHLWCYIGDETWAQFSLRARLDEGEPAGLPRDAARLAPGRRVPRLRRAFHAPERDGRRGRVLGSRASALGGTRERRRAARRARPRMVPGALRRRAPRRRGRRRSRGAPPSTCRRVVAAHRPDCSFAQGRARALSAVGSDCEGGGLCAEPGARAAPLRRGRTARDRQHARRAASSSRRDRSAQLPLRRQRRRRRLRGERVHDLGRRALAGVDLRAYLTWMLAELETKTLPGVANRRAAPGELGEGLPGVRADPDLPLTSADRPPPSCLTARPSSGTCQVSAASARCGSPDAYWCSSST